MTMPRAPLAAALFAVIATATLFASSHDARAIVRPPLMFAQFAYIHDENADAAEAYRAFLFEHERAFVTAIEFADIADTDFSVFDAVLIDPFAGWHPSLGHSWTDDLSATARHLESFDVPVVGLGHGGAAFFEAAGGYDITYSNSATQYVTAVRVLDDTHPVWNTPYDLNVETGEDIPIVNNAFEVSVLYDEGYPDVSLVGGYPANPAYHPIVEEHGDWTWGWYLGPRDLTEAGQLLFVNVLAQVIAPTTVYSTFAPGSSATP